MKFAVMAKTYLGPLNYLAILRIMVGYHFFRVGWPKLTGSFLGTTQVAGQFSAIASDPLGFHRAFIMDFVVPNAVGFSYLVALGEVAIALSFLSGCLVRVSGAFAAFYNLNIYLAVGWPNGGAQLHLNRLYIVLNSIFVLAAVGRTWGVDGWLKERFPKSWLF
jgi:thiosulfate dehydrogenase (quinone) large subunit